MQKNIYIHQELHLYSPSKNEINIFIDEILKYNNDLKTHMLAVSNYNTNDKLLNYYQQHNATNCCFYQIMIDTTIIGFITIGTFFDWNEITFYLMPQYRNLKEKYNHQINFTKLVEKFLNEYFKDKNDEHILMWGTRHFATASQHIANKLGFVFGYEVDDVNKELSNDPIKSYIFFINKKIFNKYINHNYTNKEAMKNDYYQLFNNINKSKFSLINDGTYLRLDLFLNNFFQ